MHKLQMEGAKQLNVCLVTYPFGTVVPAGLDKFIDGILAPLCYQLFIITGQLTGIKEENVKIRRLKYKFSGGKSLGARISKLMGPQLQITWRLIKLHDQYNVTIFYCTAELFILPMLVVKLFLRKNVIIIHTGNLSISYGELYRSKRTLGRVISFSLKLMEKAAFALADRIALETTGAISIMSLEKYERKIFIGGYYFVDRNIFTIHKKVDRRQNLVGYIGNFAEFKGALNFARAIPLVLSKRHDVNFIMIGGTGEEFQRIHKELEGTCPPSKIRLLGLVPHEAIAEYLNELKVLVLPSYSEGVPKIVLEAMACGTPVLATGVGGVPDIIGNEKTGFIMEKNSPECIAQNILRALNHPNLEQIARNAYALVDREYTYEKAVERYKNILDSLRWKI